MDLSNLDTVALADKGIVVELRHPADGSKLENDKGQPMTITVVGSDSAIYKGELKARVRQVSMNKKRKDEPLDLDDMEKKGATLLAKCTLGWSGLQMGGKDLAFSHQAAVDLYTSYPWIKEQVDAVVADRANLFLA